MDDKINNPKDPILFREEELIRLKKLDDLFSSASSQQLRESIHEIYLTYIIQNHEMLPTNFTRIATDIYYLLHFLDTIEKNEN